MQSPISFCSLLLCVEDSVTEHIGHIPRKKNETSEEVWHFGVARVVDVAFVWQGACSHTCCSCVADVALADIHVASVWQG